LRDAILSVLLQNFDDYELTISDNFNDERTKNVISEFRDNPHINYIRTESELNMPDHWEFATKKTRGVYVLILADRSFLRQGALRDIHDTILKSKKDIKVCFWAYGYYDEKNKVLLGEREQRGAKFFQSVDLARSFSRTLNDRFLPRPHVGCYRFDVIRKIKQDVGRLYLPFGPDYTSSFLVLAYSDIVMYIPRSLFFCQGAVLSVGTASQLNPQSYFDSLNATDPYRFVPVKAPIISSLLLNDFLKIKNLAGGNLKNINIDWVFYFGACYQELIEKKMIIPGVDQKVLPELFEEWRKALTLTDKKTQAAVRREIRRRYIRISKSYLKECFLGDFFVRVKRFLLRKPTIVFESALAAGGFKDSAESKSKF